MKRKETILPLILLGLLLFSYKPVSSQNSENAGIYMNKIGEQYKEITKDFLSYTSAVAHGKSARKVESRRVQMMQTLKDGIKKVSAMPPFEGDKSLKDSAVSYLRISLHILNDDYGKIVNLEEVAEQSYDAMEAYFLAQDLADEKRKQAGERLNAMEKEFAKKHNVNLTDSKDELSVKAAKAARVNDYYRKVYLIFFKSYKQEGYMLAAMENKDVNAIEQNRSTLLSYTEEGLKKLDTLKAFDGDKNLITACRQALEFYKMESKDKIAGLTDFYMKEESFNKIKKAFDSKKEGQRTKEDVEQYNKAVKELNDASNAYNATNQALFNGRKTAIENWNNQSSGFLDKHTPKYK